MSTKYILHIAKWYPNMDDDLEGVFVKRHIEATHKYYNSILFYARSLNEKSSGHILIIKKQVSGNNREYLGYYRKIITGLKSIDHLIKGFLYFLLMFKFLRDLYKDNIRPEIIHAHVLLRPGITAFIFSKILKVNYILTEHSTIFTNPGGISRFGIKYYLSKLIVKKANEIITVSEDLETGMKQYQLYNKNYNRIYNCVDINLYYPKKFVRNSFFQFLHVSEFKDDHKNITGLLETLKMLVDRNVLFNLHLVGYGQDLDKILNKIQVLDLAHCIIYHGKLLNKELANIYHNADALILFSNKENMPCVIAEALCCGLPVISTRVGGIHEVINETNGILIQKGNKLELLNALILVASRNRTFNPETISKEAIAKFSLHSIGGELKKIYERNIR